MSLSAISTNPYNDQTAPIQASQKAAATLNENAVISTEDRTDAVKEKALSKSPIGLPKPLTERAIILILEDGQYMVLDGEEAEFFRACLLINNLIHSIFGLIALETAATLLGDSAINQEEMPTSSKVEELPTLQEPSLASVEVSASA